MYADDPELSSDDVSLEDCPDFDDEIPVFTSASSIFYAPSEVCGPGGMHCEIIRANDSWRQEYRRHDTVLIHMDPALPGFRGMYVGRVLTFFKLWHEGVDYSCALIYWFDTLDDEPDDVTGMWIVEPEYNDSHRLVYAVIPLDSIVRSCHLIGVYGNQRLPIRFHFSQALDSFHSYYVNRYIDYHTYECIR